MPDARVAPDGTWRFGVSDADPYFSVWSSVAFFPRLEVSGRYVRIDAVPGFADPTLGDYGDKAFDAKAVLWEESQWLPALAVGTQDYVGTQLFSAHYLTLGKRIGDLDVTLGHGRRRIDGWFGGLRYTPSGARAWSVLAEYDANDYRRDYRADLSGAADRSGGATYGVEYRYGWLGTQLAYQRGDWSANLHVSIPLMRSEFIPKIDEPSPETSPATRASTTEWHADPGYRHVLGRALDRQGFADIRIRLHQRTLDVALTHERISLIGRAAGRAARAARRLGPDDIETLRIIYTVNEQPLVIYEFHDLAALDGYLAQRLRVEDLDAAVKIRFASSADALALADAAVLFFDDPQASAASGDAQYVGWRRHSSFDDVALLPFNVRLFFNDPGQSVRYDTFSALTYNRRIDHGLYLNGAARVTLFENVSDVRQSSNSVLPHVRSDIGDYRREGDRLRLDSLTVNRYRLVAERLYSRVSVGYYEEMYAGAGGQLLYLPAISDWAADVAVDGLRQRAPGEALGFRDYRVVTSLVSLHYRVPEHGVTATARVGRFLAKDEGMRFELKRRFRSGIELGAWYSVTNERDITGPGTPDNPYRDKGLFASIPLAPMLTRDTRERANMAIADYARDVGQMVISPGDLYRLVEQRMMLNSAEHNPLTGFLQ